MWPFAMQIGLCLSRSHRFYHTSQQQKKKKKTAKQMKKKRRLKEKAVRKEKFGVARQR
jgi:hypothetical protein